MKAIIAVTTFFMLLLTFMYASLHTSQLQSLYTYYTATSGFTMKLDAGN